MDRLTLEERVRRLEEVAHPPVDLTPAITDAVAKALSTAGSGEQPRTWRTNVGLHPPAELGRWMEERCQQENRTFANYVETLIIRDRAALEPGHG